MKVFVAFRRDSPLISSPPRYVETPTQPLKHRSTFKNTSRLSCLFRFVCTCKSFDVTYRPRHKRHIIKYKQATEETKNAHNYVARPPKNMRRNRFAGERLACVRLSWMARNKNRRPRIIQRIDVVAAPRLVNGHFSLIFAFYDYMQAAHCYIGLYPATAAVSGLGQMVRYCCSQSDVCVSLLLLLFRCFFLLSFVTLACVFAYVFWTLSPSLLNGSPCAFFIRL